MMNEWISPWRLTIRRLGFWLGLFFILRLIMLLGRIPQLNAAEVKYSETLLAFWHALPLDLATLSYFLFSWWIVIIPILLGWHIMARRLDFVFTAFFVTISTLLFLSEILIYKEWGTKITWKALVYLRNPREVVMSAGPVTFFLILLLASGLIGLFMLIYQHAKGTLPNIKENGRLPWLLLFILLPGLMLIGGRGGIGAIPINQSRSYFSSQYILNTLAVNGVYHIAKDFMESHRFDGANPFATLDDALAEEITRDLHRVSRDSTVKILTSTHPNIVMIILESWTADVIGSLGGEPGITPSFDSLANQGLLFSRCYVSGNRSQQAMASIFSGFPALPQTAITHHYEKFIQLPSLIKEFKSEGYNSLFVFGGDLSYGGLKAYMLHNGFDRILERKGFPRGVRRGYLGVHDGPVFDRFLREIDLLSQPFFASVFTLSSHSPYDQPWPDVIQIEGPNQPYLNSVNYTDHYLGVFMQEALHKAWYDNTLFVIVSDHSHFSHIPRTVHQAEYRHIPMLWFGSVLDAERKGSNYDRISSQTDIAATLLAQLGIPNSAYSWSRNLFNPFIQEFAYYEHNEGFGWIRPWGYLSYNVFLDHLYELHVPEEKKDESLLEGKAYLQVLFNTFRKL